MKWVLFSISIFFPFIQGEESGEGIQFHMPIYRYFPSPWEFSTAFTQSFHTWLVLKILRQLLELQG